MASDIKVVRRQSSGVRQDVHKFRKLHAWEKAIKFVTHVYAIASTYPRNELYGLIDQIHQAAVSIALHMAEGSGSGSDIEFCRFLRISQRSGYEVICGLEIANRLKYGSRKDNQALMSEADELGAMRTGLIKSLKDFV